MAQQSLSLANLQAALAQNNTKLKEWVNTQIGNIEMFSIEWVQELPTENISTATIYMIKDTNAAEGQNTYIEYVYNSTLATWEVLGEFTSEVDLSGYYDKEEVNALLAGYFNKEEVAGQITNALKDYDNKEAVNQKLAGYYKKEEVDQTIAGYYTKEQVDQSLAGYYGKDEMDTKLAALNVGGYEEQEVTTMINGLWS